jgi:hypothetical protein
MIQAPFASNLRPFDDDRGGGSKLDLSFGKGALTFAKHQTAFRQFTSPSAVSRGTTCHSPWGDESLLLQLMFWVAQTLLSVLVRLGTLEKINSL